MKAKTVWGELKPKGVKNYWLAKEDGAVWFVYDADVRWINVFGKKLGGVYLKRFSFGPGKIIGDE